MTAFFLWYFSPSLLVITFTIILGCSQSSVLTGCCCCCFFFSICAKRNHITDQWTWLQLTEDNANKIRITTSMISSKADFFFFSPPLESELESFLFTEVEDEDDAALSALAPRTELKEDRSTQLEAEVFYINVSYTETSVPWFGGASDRRTGTQVESNCKTEISKDERGKKLSSKCIKKIRKNTHLFLPHSPVWALCRLEFPVE